MAKRRPGFERYGWADSVRAPAQEFDTDAIVAQEAALQPLLQSDLERLQAAFDEGKIDSEQLATEFVDAYSRALRRYQQPADVASAEAPANHEDILDDIATFGMQAGLGVRQGVGLRIIVSFTCPDEPGVLAAVAEALANADCNIEGAMMSVVARQVTIMIVGSGGDGRSKEIQEAVEEAVADYTQIARPEVVEIKPTRMEWPRPGSTVWHLTVRSRSSTDLLEPVTKVISAAKYPLLAFSSWIEERSQDKLSGDDDDIHVVDLNFAIAPKDAREQPADTLAIAVESEIRNLIPKALVNVAPVEWPARGQPQHSVVPARENSFVMTVVGHAVPGLVHEVVHAISTDTSPARKIFGSSMAILEGFTVLTLVVENTTHGDTAALRELVAQALEVGEHFNAVVRVHALDPKPGRTADQPTHELRIQTPEQRWVLARIARTLAGSRFQANLEDSAVEPKDSAVNIVWGVSYVLDPLLGQSWPRCAMELHLQIPEGRLETLGRELRSLAESGGWDFIVLRPWSVAHDALN